MSDIIVWTLYLVVSIATYVGLLRVASRDYGVDWFLVIWSLSAFFPGVGQTVLLILWVADRDWSGGPEVPAWLRRLAGDS